MKHPRPTLWAEQNFSFPEALEERDGFLHHLTSFPSQCAIMIKEIPDEKYTVRHDGKWSIQEHLGHLLDLEELPATRIQEILDGKETLTPADMENRATWDANYNDQNLLEICERFIQRRRQLVDQFNSVPDDQWLNSGFHERLQRNMSVLDLAYFQCKHDQYHYDMILYLEGMD